MIRLEELIYALTAVVLQYHDSQNVKEKDKFCTENNLTTYYSKAIQVINNKEIKFELVLETAAENCTTKVDYKDRLPLLGFIIHQIIYLHAELNRTVSYSNEEIERNKIIIARLFREFNTLLYIPKNKTLKMTLANPIASTNGETSLLGLWDNTIKSAWLGYGAPCRSGLMLRETVLDRFHILKDSSEEDIKEIAKQIIMEHQQNILVNEQQAQIATLRAENLNQKQTHELLCEQKNVICQQLEERIAQMQSLLDSPIQSEECSANSSNPSQSSQTMSNIHYAPLLYAHLFPSNRTRPVIEKDKIPLTEIDPICPGLD